MDEKEPERPIGAEQKRRVLGVLGATCDRIPKVEGALIEPL
jgi:hypothetical protein